MGPVDAGLTASVIGLQGPAPALGLYPPLGRHGLTLGVELVKVCGRVENDQIK